MTKQNLAITIRSLNTNTPSFQRLREFYDISYINKTGKRLSESEVIDALRCADVAIAGTESYSKNVIISSGNLKAISRVGVGLDSIDLECASKHNIKVYNTPNAPTVAVAEHTVALLLAVCKNIVYYNKSADSLNGKAIAGMLLNGKKVGVIGLGRIGFKVATYLCALGCNIGFYDPYLQDKEIPEDWTRYSTIGELLGVSDIVTLHMPPASDGKPIINYETVKQFKKGAVLINTARSALIDERVLLDAVSDGTLAGAGLDVYDTLIENEGINYPQIVLTPHVASNTEESRRDMESEAIENLIAGFQKGYW